MGKPNTVRVRFAPSPTGFLHIGGLRTALYNYLFARRHNGVFILRIEDTDQSRAVPGAAEAIIRTLKRVGLEHDEGPYIQSQRLEQYTMHANQLLKKNLAYECFCTSEELEAARQVQIAAKQPTIYTKKCRRLSKTERADRVSGKHPYVIRLAVPEEGSTSFDDVIRGTITFENRLIDDTVLVKSDGFPTYHLANVVDDHLLEISHVIRGEEWISSTPKHIILYHAFGWDPPAFAHLPLLLNPDRSKLSKRQTDASAESYLDRGYLPEALLNFVALLGWNPRADREVYGIAELIEAFDLKSVNASGAVVNLEKLDWLNAQHLRGMTPEAYALRAIPYLAAAGLITPCPGGFVNEETGIVYATADLMEVVSLERDRVKKHSDLPEALRFVFSDNLPYNQDLLLWKGADRTATKERVSALREVLERENVDWTETGLEQTIKSWIAERGWGTGEVLWPMRAALTGRDASPGPFAVAAVLGRERTLHRLKIAIEKLS